LALVKRQYALAAKVIAAGEAEDRREVKIEEECLKILALHQPVAIDMRRLASVMKINNDLGRHRMPLRTPYLRSSIGTKSRVDAPV
jgi:phosphate transport system protein